MSTPRIKTLSPQPFVAIRTQTTSAQFGVTLQNVLEDIWRYLNTLESVTVGPAIARYHAVSNQAIDVEAGFPCAEQVPTREPIALSELPGGKAATLLHWGPYATLPDSYDELEAWMREQKLAAAGPPWEIYWVDPSQTDIEADQRTEIVWPILIS